MQFSKATVISFRCTFYACVHFLHYCLNMYLSNNNCVFLLISFFSFSRPQDSSCQARLQHPRPNRSQSEGSRWASTALVRLRPPRQLRDFCQSANRSRAESARWKRSSLRNCHVLPRQLLQILQTKRKPAWCSRKQIGWQRDCKVAKKYEISLFFSIPLSLLFCLFSHTLSHN